MNLDLILLILAAVAFALAAFDLVGDRISAVRFIAAGLFLWVLTLLV